MGKRVCAFVQVVVGSLLSTTTALSTTHLASARALLNLGGDKKKEVAALEAEDGRCLKQGARGLAIRVARAINRALGREGSVWGDRYHARALRTPREVRHGLVYVLMNFRKHRPWDRRPVDPCSSASWFEGFRTGAPVAREGAPVCRPRTWLGSVGWRRHGLVGAWEKPAAGPEG